MQLQKNKGVIWSLCYSSWLIVVQSNHCVFEQKLKCIPYFHAKMKSSPLAGFMWKTSLFLFFHAVRVSKNHLEIYTLPYYSVLMLCHENWLLAEALGSFHVEKPVE